MPKVALYARYSTDNQSVVSIEDQFRICREHAGRERWQVIDTYHDAAISGASVILRPGVQSLLQDAQRGKFDIVLAEALDRVSRDVVCGDGLRRVRPAAGSAMATTW